MESAEVKEYIKSEEDQNVKAAEFEIQKKKKIIFKNSSSSFENKIFAIIRK